MASVSQPPKSDESIPASVAVKAVRGEYGWSNYRSRLVRMPRTDYRNDCVSHLCARKTALRMYGEERAKIESRPFPASQASAPAAGVSRVFPGMSS